jgi:hypothetical protein
MNEGGKLKLSTRARRTRPYLILHELQRWYSRQLIVDVVDIKVFPRNEAFSITFFSTASSAPGIVLMAQAPIDQRHARVDHLYENTESS